MCTVQIRQMHDPERLVCLHQIIQLIIQYRFSSVWHIQIQFILKFQFIFRVFVCFINNFADKKIQQFIEGIRFIRNSIMTQDLHNLVIDFPAMLFLQRFQFPVCESSMLNIIRCRITVKNTVVLEVFVPMVVNFLDPR